jgi:hypothetical protein
MLVGNDGAERVWVRLFSKKNKNKSTNVKAWQKLLSLCNIYVITALVQFASDQTLCTDLYIVRLNLNTFLGSKISFVEIAFLLFIYLLEKKGIQACMYLNTLK